MKRTSLMIDERLIESVSNVYDSQSDGMTAALDSFMAMRKRCLHAIKGILTNEELTSICDSYNGTIMERDYFSFNHFEHQMSDAELYESSCSKHGADLVILLEKTKAMGYAELFFLLEEVNRFWNVEKAYGSPAPKLDMFLSTYGSK